MYGVYIEGYKHGLYGVWVCLGDLILHICREQCRGDFENYLVGYYRNIVETNNGYIILLPE